MDENIKKIRWEPAKGNGVPKIYLPKKILKEYTSKSGKFTQADIRKFILERNIDDSKGVEIVGEEE